MPDYGPQYEPYNPVQPSNTFTGGSSYGFNPNSLIDSIFSSLGPTLAGIGYIIYATKADGSKVPVYQNTGLPVYPTNPTPTTGSNNTLMYIGIAILVLLLVVAGAYFLKK